MSWLLWRQHRMSALWTAGALILFGVVATWTGIHMAHDYTSAQHACEGAVYCNSLSNLFNGDGAIIDTVRFTVVLPVLLGVFFGAPMIARETEHATNVLAWSQSVTRRRWLWSKLATVVGATIAISAAVAALVTWWSGTLNSLDSNRFEGVQFATQNIAPIAYSLFAVALGLACGAAFRRTLPAIATTVAGYAAVRLLLQVYAQPHYLAASTLVTTPQSSATAPSGSWVLSSTLVDRLGHSVSGPVAVIPGCDARVRPGPCLARAGYRIVTKYQPPSHYWPLQWIDVAIYGVLAAVLVTVAAVLTLRRDA